jgi:phosphate starvation-inducible PhoH-like protein
MRVSRIFFALALCTRFGATNASVLRMSTKRAFSGAPLSSLKASPANARQITLARHLRDPRAAIVVAHGPAGTGKTLLACAAAVEALAAHHVSRIIVTRPALTVDDEQLGFLPGSVEDKMAPFTRPVFDAFTECTSKRQVADMIASGTIEVVPLAFMRGRTFKHAFVVADEMQNASPAQVQMLTTRVGLGSRLVLTGDLAQSDRGPRNGLADFLDRIRDGVDQSDYPEDPAAAYIRSVELLPTDVMRSPIVAQVLQLYQ